MLSKPILALASDRTKTAKKNEYCGDPEEWFDSAAFRKRNLYATAFDFFVNWETNSVCDEVWIKRISDSDEIHNQSALELMKLISDCDGKEKSNRLYRFMRHQNMSEKYMLFRDVPEKLWDNGQEKVVELDMSKCYTEQNLVSQLDAEEIQERISQLRRYPAKLGQAGLIYSTSSLEGYLSHKPYFWPGDADTVLFDENNEVTAVIEFKKHTASSKIPFSEQKLKNYLERDILKYKSLALLRDRFKTNLYVLYYPIPRDINYMIIEKIDGNVDALYASARYELDLPDRTGKGVETFAAAFTKKVLGR